MTDTNRPKWEDVMKPLADSELWQAIRRAASELLESRLHDMGDYDSGISSSDINHTVFGVAAPIFSLPDGGGWVRGYAWTVLDRLEEEAAGYR